MNIFILAAFLKQLPRRRVIGKESIERTKQQTVMKRRGGGQDMDKEEVQLRQAFRMKG